MKRRWMYLVVGFVLILIGGMGAQSERIIYTFIQEGVVNGVDYATGGVGIEERAEMNQMVDDYNLKLSFAELTGHYLSGIVVTIKNSEGDIVFNKQSQGPWFLLKLPEGAYQVIASHDGQTKRERVMVGQQCQTLLFHWKS